ncbi:MAG TPA: Ig-like domain-containing protein [Terriglobales bacterium]|nr:Ig-like domain-containing protein [Terriglobales bacterium]
MTKITVTPTPVSVAVGQQTTFYASPVDANNNAVNNVAVTWNSSSASVATINSSGVATGVGGGTTQITASYSGVTSNTATLTVTPVVASIKIQPMSPAITVGATQQFTATALDSSGNTITGVTFSWYCSFAAVATIDAQGLAKGVSPGTVTIVASVGNVTSQPATLTVNP